MIQPKILGGNKEEIQEIILPEALLQAQVMPQLIQGEDVYKRKKDKCYIVGFAPSWKMTPFTDPDAEVWCLNEFYKLLQQVPGGKADRWFEIHSRVSPSKNKPEHIGFLQNCPVPLYMWEHYDDMPNSIRFPKDEIVKWLEDQGKLGAKYFTNTISWITAMAMWMGFKEIHVYGVDMATDSEYQGQRPSSEYFIGLAEGLGIKFYIPDESDLMKCAGLYGFETDNQMRVKMKNRIKDLEENRKKAYGDKQKLEMQLHQIEAAIMRMDGAIEDSKFWLKNWTY
jgi:hypothetical protein